MMSDDNRYEPWEGFYEEGQEAYDSINDARMAFVDQGYEGLDLIAANGLATAAEEILKAADNMAIYGTINDVKECAIGTQLAVEAAIGYVLRCMTMVGRDDIQIINEQED